MWDGSRCFAPGHHEEGRPRNGRHANTKKMERERQLGRRDGKISEKPGIGGAMEAKGRGCIKKKVVISVQGGE